MVYDTNIYGTFFILILICVSQRKFYSPPQQCVKKKAIQCNTAKSIALIVIVYRLKS